MNKLIEQPDEPLYVPSDYIFYLYDVYAVAIIFSVSAVFLINYGTRNGLARDALSEGGASLYVYLDEIEEECGQIEDAVVYVIYFAVFVL